MVGPVATLTFDRPSSRNALSFELLGGLRPALASATAAGVRAVILNGADDCFSSGADISDLKGTAEDATFDELLSEVISGIRTSPLLVIAAIEGACIGAALDLACACDIRIASPTAFFELPAVRLGLLYNPTAIARLQRTLPTATLRRLLLSGERIEGSQALCAGIATHVAERSQALAIAGDIARRTITFSSRALIESKRFLNALDDGVTDLDRWQSIRIELLRSPERQAALTAAKSRLVS
jgi:enoyl-CoA hydratase